MDRPQLPFDLTAVREPVASRIWVAAGLSEVADPLEVTDAFTAVVRAVLRSGGTVALWHDRTLSSLALYIAREEGVDSRVEVWNSPGSDAAESPQLARFTGFEGFRAATDVADAVHRSATDASVYLGGGSPVVVAHRAAATLPQHDGLVVAGTGGDAARLRSFSTAARMPDEVSEILRTKRSYPFVVSVMLARVQDRLNPLPTPRVDTAGLRRVLGRGLG